MSENEIQFAEGLYFKKNDNAPDFIVGKLSINWEQFSKWAREERKKGDDWANLEIKQAKSGKYYISVDTWKPEKKENPEMESSFTDTEDNLPF